LLFKINLKENKIEFDFEFLALFLRKGGLPQDLDSIDIFFRWAPLPKKYEHLQKKGEEIKKEEISKFEKDYINFLKRDLENPSCYLILGNRVLSFYGKTENDSPLSYVMGELEKRIYDERRNMKDIVHRLQEHFNKILEKKERQVSLPSFIQDFYESSRKFSIYLYEENGNYVFRLPIEYQFERVKDYAKIFLLKKDLIPKISGDVKIV